MIINEPFQLNQAALRSQLKSMEDMLANVPQHVLEEAMHHQQIDAHNMVIAEKQAKKKQLREMAKKAKLPTRVLKRMISSVKKVK